jgi:deoxyribodipyrimidine photo-lyase
MTAAPLTNPGLWVHGEALGPANPALLAWPGRPAVFVFDDALIAGTGAMPSQGLSLKRLGFLYECLLELPVTIRRGDVAAEVLAFARRHDADGVVTTAAVDPRFAQLCKPIGAALPLQVLPVEPFVDLEAGALPPGDLRRFSRYWKRAEALVWERWPGLSSGPGSDQSSDQIPAHPTARPRGARPRRDR